MATLTVNQALMMTQDAVCVFANLVLPEVSGSPSVNKSIVEKKVIFPLLDSGVGRDNILFASVDIGINPFIIEFAFTNASIFNALKPLIECGVFVNGYIAAKGSCNGHYQDEIFGEFTVKDGKLVKLEELKINYGGCSANDFNDLIARHFAHAAKSYFMYIKLPDEFSSGMDERPCYVSKTIHKQLNGEQSKVI